MDSSGFIVPPPNLIPPREDTGTETRRAPVRSRELPAFRPPAAAPAGEQAAGIPERRPWRLTLPTGRTIPLTGTTLVGRNPVQFGPWTDAELIVVEDPAASVSKTHASFEPAEDAVRVTDAHSTNGVAVTAPDGSENELTPGVAAEVVDGSVVHLGRFAVRVQRA
ncbi:FHA domain-containing protein [Leifsonia sp. NPDC058292]|uniref:FHA domain-containing protein n=1 Tax=Leifsonia sp. NPDC058292 TaxID=3346428 RepID=UPI0036DA0C8D